MERIEILRAARSLLAASILLVASPARADWADFLGSDKAVWKTASGTRHDPSFPSGANRTPSMRWTQWLGNVHSSPVEADGSVYIGIGAGGIAKLGLSTGSVLWAAPVGTVHSAPAVADDGRVYAITDQGAVRAVSSANGQVVLDLQVETAGAHWSAISIGDGRVHYSTMLGKVGAIDAASGSWLFSRTLDSSAFTYGTIWGGRVHHCTESTIVYALDPTNGQTIWQHVPSDKLYASPVIGGGRLFAGAGDTETLYAYDASSGVLLWTYAVGSPVYATVAYANAVVYVCGSAGRVAALDGATGSVLWSHETMGQIHGSPAVGGDTLYVATDQNKLWAFDASTGSIRWTYDTGDPVLTITPDPLAGRFYRNSIGLAGGTVLFPYGGGKLSAIDILSTAAPTASPTSVSVTTQFGCEGRYELQARSNLVGPAGRVAIRYAATGCGRSEIALFNTAGERLATLARVQGPAEGSLEWDGTLPLTGSSVASGVYVLRLTSPGKRPRFARIALVH